MVPKVIKLMGIAKYYTIMKKSERPVTLDGEETTLDTATHYKQWHHPADQISILNEDKARHYSINIYTDGNKNEHGVG